MAKTKRLLQENLKLVDLVIELVDARIPMSSRNPDISNIIGVKPRILVFNKSDLADQQVIKLWESWFKKMNENVVIIDSITGNGLKNIPYISREILKERIDRDIKKGIVNRPIRLMVVGIPNVGKSSFINKFAGKASTKTGDKPGVTRGKQWIRIRDGYELLDTPGILWPKFEDINAGQRLAYTGAIKDEIIQDIEALACGLLDFLKEMYLDNLIKRYKLNKIDGLDGYGLLKEIGRKRGFILSGAEVDTNRAAIILLDEFRAGKIGRISLERP